MLERFKCVGPECVATCCGGGWRIAVESATLDRWLTLGLPAEALTRAEGALTVMRTDSARRCVALTGGGLCSLHRDHGESALPSGCAQFPRFVVVLPGRVEATLTLACPEVARLALTDPDALTWAELPVSVLPREEGELPQVGPRWARAEALSKFAQAVIVRREVDLGVRWFAIADLAFALDALPAAAPPAEVGAVLRARAAAWAEGSTAALHTSFAPGVADALDWVDGLLRREAQSEHLGPLIRAARGESGLRMRAESYEARRSAARGRADSPSESFERHALHILMERHPYAEDDGATWVQRQLGRQAALQALVWLADPMPVDWRASTADVAWRIAREVEHASRASRAASPWWSAPTLKTLGAVGLLTAL